MALAGAAHGLGEDQHLQGAHIVLGADRSGADEGAGLGVGQRRGHHGGDDRGRGQLDADHVAFAGLYDQGAALQRLHGAADAAGGLGGCQARGKGGGEQAEHQEAAHGASFLGEPEVWHADQAL